MDKSLYTECNTVEMNLLAEDVNNSLHYSIRQVQRMC